jgi:hypothetical protein
LYLVTEGAPGCEGLAFLSKSLNAFTQVFTPLWQVEPLRGRRSALSNGCA